MSNAPSDSTDSVETPDQKSDAVDISHSDRNGEGEEYTARAAGDVSSNLAGAIDEIFNRQFSDWAYSLEQQRNLDDGYGVARNDPSHVPDAKTFSPSQLFACPRQQFYSARNAPQEEPLPQGLFKFGHDFEDLYQTYLEEIVSPNVFIQNTVHVEFAEGNVQFSGSTDPVLTDRVGMPLLLTEIKTTKNLHFVRRDGVSRRHKAQAHAYARGLKIKYGLEAPPAIKFIYASRETLEIEQFDVEFDPEFWNDVVDWAQETAHYQIEDIFPPTIDEDHDFLCSYCEYSERCGNYEPGNKPGQHGGDWDKPVDDYWWDDTIAHEMMNRLDDQSVAGFIPLKRYPETQTVEHLQAHPNVLLTPTVAAAHPDLVDDGTPPAERLLNTYGIAPQRDVYDWRCIKCSSTFEYGTFDWEGDIDDSPTCPTCEESDEVSATTLRGPTPDQQARMKE